MESTTPRRQSATLSPLVDEGELLSVELTLLEPLGDGVEQRPFRLEGVVELCYPAGLATTRRVLGTPSFHSKNPCSRSFLSWR